MRSQHDYRRLVDERPTGYFLHDQPGWEETCAHILGNKLLGKTLTVYARPIHIETTGDSGAARFDFSELCARNLGPADYLTIASSFSTIIIDNVPILTLTMKNEARRFITLLDALYECRVKLLIRAATSPEILFFPDADSVASEDLLWKESYSKAQLDMTNPYRPNISTYTGRNQSETVVKVPLVDRPVDSSRLTAFTGEDERFAYRRAVSRLFEMTSKRWWESQTHLPLKELAWSSTKHDVAADMKSEKQKLRNVVSPFLIRKKAPSFFDGHFWGVMKWGPRAGRWGMGA
jgi:peroxisome-assembly ATPase